MLASIPIPPSGISFRFISSVTARSTGIVGPFVFLRTRLSDSEIGIVCRPRSPPPADGNSFPRDVEARELSYLAVSPNEVKSVKLFALLVHDTGLTVTNGPRDNEVLITVRQSAAHTGTRRHTNERLVSARVVRVKSRIKHRC